MALLFCDSFDHYATADITTKWNNARINIPGPTGTSTVTIGAFGRNGTNGARFTWGVPSQYPYIARGVSASGATAIIGAAFNPNSLSPTSSANPLYAIFDSATVQCSLRVNADGSVSVLRGGYTGTVLGTSSAGVISIGAYSYVELKVVLSTTTGSYEVRVNNTLVLSGSGANTAGASTTAWTEARIGAIVGTRHLQTGTWDFDDVYIADGSGSTNNDFLGPIRVIALLPDGDGASSDFTPSEGEDNYAMVNEASADGDTTYVSATNAGDHDTYTFEDLAVNGTVKAVQTNLIVRSDAAGAETIAPVIRVGSTDYDGTTVGVTTTYADSREIFETSPATGVAWTPAEINGAEFGIKLVG